MQFIFFTLYLYASIFCFLLMFYFPSGHSVYIYIIFHSCYYWSHKSHLPQVVMTACSDLNQLLWPSKQDFCAGSADTWKKKKKKTSLNCAMLWYLAGTGQGGKKKPLTVCIQPSCLCFGNPLCTVLNDDFHPASLENNKTTSFHCIWSPISV